MLDMIINMIVIIKDLILKGFIVIRENPILNMMVIIIMMMKDPIL